MKGLGLRVLKRYKDSREFIRADYRESSIRLQDGIMFIPLRLSRRQMDEEFGMRRGLMKNAGKSVLRWC